MAATRDLSGLLQLGLRFHQRRSDCCNRFTGSIARLFSSARTSNVAALDLNCFARMPWPNASLASSGIRILWSARQRRASPKGRAVLTLHFASVHVEQADWKPRRR